jgi:uncharacterized membrane protein
MTHSYLYTLIMSMIPISELRGAIPLGVSLGLSPLVATVISVFGNALVVPFLLLLIEPMFERLKTLTRLRNWIERYEARAMTKFQGYERFRFWGLLLFVAVPFPTTGAYTGCVIAVMLGMKFKSAWASITGGVIISGFIVFLLTSQIVSIL